MELQRWRCPDCNAVFDVFVGENGRAEEMRDELCPAGFSYGRTRLGVLDETETALFDGEGGGGA